MGSICSAASIITKNILLYISFIGQISVGGGAKHTAPERKLLEPDPGNTGVGNTESTSTFFGALLSLFIPNWKIFCKTFLEGFFHA